MPISNHDGAVECGSPCVFAYDAFVKNNESIVKVQRAFKIHFNIGRHGAVPDRKTIMRWVTAFRTTGKITKKKNHLDPYVL